MGDKKNNTKPTGWEQISGPELKYVYGAYVIVAIAVGVAVLLAKLQDVTIEISQDFAAFAVIYIAAQAIERLVQPITYLVGKPDEKKEAKTALTASSQRANVLAQRDPVQAEAEADTAVRAQKALAVIQSERAVLFWAIATAFALVISGALDLGFIESVAEVSGGEDDKVPASFHYLDIIITGAVIGAGTKPLHDLIKVIQNAKQKTDTPGSEATA